MLINQTGRIAEHLDLLGDAATPFYLVRGGEKWALVDAAVAPMVPELVKQLKAYPEAGQRLGYFLITHSHFDHVGALETLAAKTGASVYAHREEIGELAGCAARATEEGSEIRVGRITITCMHTPGHTRGSQCFIAGRAIFTGDTLFIDGCGRVDLPGSDPAQMVASLARLATLDPAIVVYPGHDYGGSPAATIGELLRSNPYLSATSEEALL